MTSGRWQRYWRAARERLAPAPPYRQGWEPGHFYSPIPDLEEVAARAGQIFDYGITSIPGVDLNEAGQAARFGELSRFYADQPFADEPGEKNRYGFANPNFQQGEAIILQAFMRSSSPRRIIEVGSGHSSAAMLDTDEIFLGRRTEITFIEPYPQLLESLMRPGDKQRVAILPSPIQDVPLDLFATLESGDILFVDSSHVAKTGSDVNHIFFRVLPLLAPGVLVHFHDINYPFEYPREWVMGGRSWNEAYLLRAFLMYNHAFRIEFFAGYWAWHRHAELEAGMPLCARSPGSSIWLQRVAE